MKKNRVVCLLLLIVSLAFGDLAVNQVGYLPKSAKYVFFDCGAKKFQVIDTKTEKAVFDGSVLLWQEADAASGNNVYRGDFSRLESPGQYYICDEAGNRSATFVVGRNVYDDLYKYSLKSFYIQRCGMELTPEFAEDFAHPACHVNNGVYHSSAGKKGGRAVTGGWHDAGDYGKYIVNGAYSVAVMLTGYEIYKEGFQDDDIGIPESGNGIPDYLDECRYELEWFLKMQDEDGGVFHKITSANFVALDLQPQEYREPRLIIFKSTTATADFVAVMAKAARIYAQYDEQFSDRCKQAALKGWGYLGKNSGLLPQKFITNPEGIHTGNYGDWNDTDERLWAAVEMLITFGDEKYNQFYKEKIGQQPQFDEMFSWNTVQNFAHINYLIFAKGSKTDRTKKFLREQFKNYCDSLQEKHKKSGYHVLLKDGDYGWGSCQMALNAGFMMLVGADIFQNLDYRAVGVDQCHYNLGANCLNTSFVTGFGEYSPKNIHNRHCSLTEDWRAFPGFLVGGPNENLQDNALKEHYDENTPPARCWIDVKESYASNETCINWNAILVVYAGYLKGLEY